MKLVRFGEAGKEKPGVLDKDGHIHDLSAHVKDITGDVLSDESLKRISEIDPATLPRLPDGVRLGAPVATPSKFVAIGLNYSDHAAEVGMPLPTEPIVFLKAVTSICGPNDAVEKPRNSIKLDWECELGIVIGKRPTSPATASATTCRNGTSSSSGRANGPRASRTTPSARSGPGSSPARKSPIRIT
jgi:2,4-didehydro-3-deoxy-L-rhamnonate hydrolase